MVDMAKIERNMNIKTIVATTILGAVIYLIASANCMPNIRVKAAGTLAGQPFQAMVDGQLAKGLIEGDSSAVIRALTREADAQPIVNQMLAELLRKTSMDFATFYLLDRWYREPQNKAAQDDYGQFVQQISITNTLPETSAALRQYLIVFVPGLAYREDTTTGADFARQRRLLDALGIANTLIETDEWGSTEDNAQMVAQKIRDLQTDSRPILLVSASKGGLECALALGKILRPEETLHLKAWVSVGGILRGSPVADRYLCFPRCWLAEVPLFLKGKNMDIVRDISHRKRSVEFDALQFPPHLLNIQLVGAPLATKISREIRGRWCNMRHIAPNDGLTTLPDQVIPGSIIVSEPGLDHFFRDPAIDVKTLALACVAAKY